MWFPPLKLSLNIVPPLGGATIHKSLRHVELTSGIPFEGIREVGDMNRLILSANLCIQSVECVNYFLFLCCFFFFFFLFTKVIGADEVAGLFIQSSQNRPEQLAR